MFNHKSNLPQSLKEPQELDRLVDERITGGDVSGRHCYPRFRARHNEAGRGEGLRSAFDRPPVAKPSDHSTEPISSSTVTLP